MYNALGLTAVDIGRAGLSIFVHTLAYACGLSFVRKQLSVGWPLLIAGAVAVIGYLAAYFHIAVPIPVGVVILLFLTRFRLRDTAVAYLITWIVYAFCHILLSGLLRYNALIPAWPLRS